MRGSLIDHIPCLGQGGKREGPGRENSLPSLSASLTNSLSYVHPIWRHLVDPSVTLGDNGQRKANSYQASQSLTTVCSTVSASPVTRAVTGSPPGTISEERRRRIAVHDSGAANPAR